MQQLDQWLRDSSTVARFASIDAPDFKQELERRGQVVARLEQQVSQAVEQDQITPLEGLKIVSCVHGTLYAYEEFHPRGQSTPEQSITHLLGAGEMYSKTS